MGEGIERKVPFPKWGEGIERKVPFPKWEGNRKNSSPSHFGRGLGGGLKKSLTLTFS